MPLSEDEQRILRQIEEQFYESDPKFAQQVGTSSIYRHALRRIRWAVLGLIAGLAFLIATLQIHFLVAFLGFLIMLACAFVIERNIRQIVKMLRGQMTWKTKLMAHLDPRVAVAFAR